MGGGREKDKKSLLELQCDLSYCDIQTVGCGYATPFICSGLSGHSSLGRALAVSVANTHSGAGLEASGVWGVEQCTIPHMQDTPCPIPLVILSQ